MPTRIGPNGQTSAPLIPIGRAARPSALGRCGQLMVALLLVLLIGAVSTASAATTIDIRGTYVGTSEANGSTYSGKSVIDQENCAAGTFSGRGVGYSNFSGTINGNQLVSHEVYTNVAYTADGTSTLSTDSQGRLVNSGNFHDSNGQSGTFSSTRISKPSDNICATGAPPPPPDTRHATTTKLSCGYHPLLAQDDCLASVVDGSASPSAPTGTVTFTASRGSNGNGAFAFGNTCSLTATGRPDSSSCAVVYLPPTVGLTALQADYAGDAAHRPSTTGGASATHASCPPSKFKTITCADPNAVPGVCKATGPTYPQCSQPTLVPVACLTQVIGSTCQSSGNYTVACGSIGTGLPECAHHPQAIPNVCGPSSSILPPCTGANDPVTICGPIGSGLPACSFTTKITGAVLDPVKDSGEVDVTVNCGSAQEAGASPNSSSRARVSTLFQGGPSCSAQTRLALWFNDQNMLLAEAARRVQEVFYQRAVNTGHFDDPQADQSVYSNYAIHNSNVVGQRIAHVNLEVFPYLSIPPPSAPSYQDALRYLIPERSPQGNYIGPNSIWDYYTPGGVSTFLDDYVTKLFRANDEASRLLSPSSSKSTRFIARTTRSAATGGPRSLAGRSLRIRLGHRVKLRLRLSSATVRSLIRSGITRHAVPLRLLVVYRTKRGVVARFVDFPLRALKSKRPVHRRG